MIVPSRRAEDAPNRSSTRPFTSTRRCDRCANHQDRKRTNKDASMDKNDTVKRPRALGALFIDVENHGEAAASLPCGSLSETDQRQIQAAFVMGFAGRAAALWRAQERAAARRRRNGANRAPRAQPRTQG